MKLRSAIIAVIFVLIFATAQLILDSSNLGQVYAQIPTVSIPTVTGTASGPMVTVRPDSGEAQINVRSGPGTSYDKVGVLLVGQTVPAKGRSSGGDWIMVEYVGAPGNIAWVHAPLVSLSSGNLPVVEPPPTPTPLVTNTIDPTLAAQFIVTVEPSRLPTFTEPPPIVYPTFPAAQAAPQRAGIPMGLVIIVLASVGLFVGLFTLAQGK